MFNISIDTACNQTFDSRTDVALMTGTDVEYLSESFNCYMIWSISTVTSVNGGNTNLNKWTLEHNADMSFSLRGTTLTEGSDYQVIVQGTYGNSTKFVDRIISVKECSTELEALDTVSVTELYDAAAFTFGQTYEV